MKKYFSIICVFSLILMIMPFNASAKNLQSEIDEFLATSGVSVEIIKQMPFGQKQVIYENIGNKEAEFSGYDARGFQLDNEGKLQFIAGVSASSSGNMQIQGGLISKSDLTLSVVGFKTTVSSGGKTWTEYSVYPSFVWKKLVKVKNDSFAMSMYSGWEAVPGERNLRLHLFNSQGQSAQHVDLNPNNASSSGYSYKVPTNTGFMQGSYQGHSYYNLKKTASNATPAISLHYAHDYSSSMTLSYSLNVGNYGSISLSGNVSKINEMSDNFNVSGLS